MAILTFAFALLIFSNENSGLIGKVMKGKILTTLGKWSYSIYLTHVIIITIVELIYIEAFKIYPSSIQGTHSLVINVLIVSLTVLISKFSFQFIEDKYRTLSKKILIAQNKI